MTRENFIEMAVGGLTLDPVTKTPIVILKDPDRYNVVNNHDFTFRGSRNSRPCVAHK